MIKDVEEVVFSDLRFGLVFSNFYHLNISWEGFIKYIMKSCSGFTIRKLYKLFSEYFTMSNVINDLLFRPEWFIGTETIFEIVGVLVTFFIGYYSYRVYKLSGNKKYHYLGVGFLAMALGFLFKVLSNLVVLYYKPFIKLISLIPVKLTYLYTGSLILYSFLVLSGYIVLACLAANIRNRRIIVSLSFIALLASLLIRQARSFTFFYFFAFVLLVVYIVPYMHENYKNQKSKSSYLVFLAFLFLTLANLVFIGMGAYGVRLYVVGYAISLLAYLVLIINLFLVLRK